MTLTVLLAEAKAHRWSLLGPSALLLALLAQLTSSWRVVFPMVDDPVAARVVINLVIGLLMLLPLYPSYPELEQTLAREVPGRLLRVLLSTALGLLVYLPTFAAGDGGRPAETFFCLGVAAAVVATTLVGELSWVVPLAVGVLAIILNNSGAHHVTRAMDAVPPVIAYVVLALAFGWYTVRGPLRILT